ncbi:MAG: PcfJ domain-containing protein [Pseudomonadota bacterium]
MPRKKQPRLLRRTGSGGEPLARSKQRVSFGIDRQEARSRHQLFEETDPVALAEADRGDQWYAWVCADRERDYDYEGRFHERSLDELQALLGELTTQRTLMDALPDEVRATWLPVAAAEVDATVDREGLEWRIVYPWGEEGTVSRSQLLSAIGGGHNVSLVNRLLRSCSQPFAAETIFYFAPLWIRGPDSFSGSTLRALVEHLFVRYPVPECLYRAWERSAAGVQPDYKWLRWFLIYGQGGSLSKASAIDYGWSVSRRFQHCFALAPGHLSPLLATQHAEFERLDLAAGTRRLLWSDRRLMRDLTAQWTDLDRRRIEQWTEFALWLERWHDVIAPLDVSRLLDWAAHERAVARSFSWSGRSATAALARARAHREQQLARLHGRRSLRRWRAHGMNWDGLPEKPGLWRIRELLSDLELVEEGLRLRHCVGSYGFRCVDGSSAIFALLRLNQPWITIELDLATGSIRQALGRRNRAATAEEQTVLQRWHAEVVQPVLAAGSNPP